MYIYIHNFYIYIHMLGGTVEILSSCLIIFTYIYIHTISIYIYICNFQILSSCSIMFTCSHRTCSQTHTQSVWFVCVRVMCECVARAVHLLTFVDWHTHSLCHIWTPTHPHTHPPPSTHGHRLSLTHTHTQTHNRILLRCAASHVSIHVYIYRSQRRSGWKYLGIPIYQFSW